jgi:D-aspartate ligase
VPRTAVVLGLRPAGLALVRALAREGVPVGGIGFDGADVGFASRYLTWRWQVADADESRADERVLDALAGLARRGRLVLFPELDLPVEIVLRRWNEIRAVADVPLPDDPDIVRRLAAKDTLLAVAAEAGVPTPRTVVPRGEEDVRDADLPLPFLVKPVASEAYARRFAHKLVRAGSPEEAVAAWRRASEAGFATVLQEEVPAHDRVFSLFTYVGRAGAVLASVVGRKVRQIPRRYGAATVFRIELEPRVLELGHRLLSSAGYRGFAQVELAHDVRTDSFLLLEVNTRPPIWCGIAMTREWNMARVAYADLAGGRPRELGVLEGDATWIYGLKDAWISAQMALRGETTPGGVVAPYRAGRKMGALFARDDPRPALAVVGWAAGVGARRLAGRVIGGLRRSGRYPRPGP